jgi:uncharacterized coiled-coil protein SlyX
MEELIKYFESLESRLAAQEQRIATLEAKVEALQNQPQPEPQVVEKIVEKVVEVEKPVEVIKEVIKEVMVEKPAEPVVPEDPVKIEEPVIEPEPVKEPEEPVVEPEKKPVPELFDEPQASKAVLYGKPVDDIRQAISLGDRFLYQRELFGQNAELMQRTLTDLNALRSFDEAVSYIMTHFQWDADSSTYQQFIVTLHRRFG